LKSWIGRHLAFVNGMANFRKLLRSVRRAAVIGAGATAGAYLGAVASAWFRYGRPRSATFEPDRLLDRFIPVFDIVERHQVRVNAPANITFAAACDLEFEQSPLIAMIFKARERILGSARDAAGGPRGLLERTKSSGWGVLAEISGREIVMGAVTRPWEANVVFRALPPDQFASFNEPGYVKIVWTLRTDGVGEGLSMARTETRAVATNGAARRRFRRYWALFSPGIVLIRYEALRLVKADAEQRAQAGNPVPGDRFALATGGGIDLRR
jgi:hypothetical protein